MVNRSKQALILSAPGGAIGAFATLTIGWYADKKVCQFSENKPTTKIIACNSLQNERMVPIVISMIPTMIGTAMLVGLNDSGKKGALLFGLFYFIS